jgi:hypothetical protein
MQVCLVPSCVCPVPCWLSVPCPWYYLQQTGTPTHSCNPRRPQTHVQWHRETRACTLRHFLNSVERSPLFFFGISPTGNPAGYYGTSDTATFGEASNGGSDYLAEVCREWEAAATGAQVDRSVIIRTGDLSHRVPALVIQMFRVFINGSRFYSYVPASPRWTVLSSFEQGTFLIAFSFVHALPMYYCNNSTEILKQHCNNSPG